MNIQTMEVKNIRSYTHGLFQFSEGVNIIVGPNASGKTNLLEAIHMLCIGRPFKSSDSDMVRRGEEWARIDMSVDGDTRVLKLSGTPLQKTFTIGDTERKRLTQPVQVPIVLFEPSHMLLLSGEPEKRRSYIDGIISQVEPGFKTQLRSYKRALAQRNRLLKQEHTAQEDVFVWDVRLCEIADTLVRYRTEYIDLINNVFTDNYRHVSGGDEALQLTYQSDCDTKNYSDSLLKQLKDGFALDKLRGFTGAGPHRDDLRVMIDGNNAKNSASRGETRSIVLALKVAELGIVRDKTSAQPILLLDDVFGELDAKRRRMLAAMMSGHQTFITTTDADAIIKNFMENYNVITIG